MSAFHTTGVATDMVGPYRLLAELGRGGMATVFLALNHGPAGFDKLVVVKQANVGCTEDADVVGMFLDEAGLAARMRHHNLVQTYAVGEDDGRPYMVMEYLEGQPLSRILHRLGKSVPLRVYLRIVSDVLSGLHHAHELTDYDGHPLGVVHRDATPQNVIVTYDGAVKVVDFGIAKADTASVHTAVGVVKGKIAYLAPEYIAGEGVDRRADIFSVGVMLWEMIAGERPWKNVPELTILRSVVDGQFPSLRAAAPGVPEALAVIVDRALARRDERYPTAAALQADLDAYLAASGSRTSPRQIGALLARAFAPERSALTAAVEAQIRALRAAPAAPSTLDGPRALPVIENPPTPSAFDQPPATVPAGRGSAARGDVMPRGDTTPIAPTVVSAGAPSTFPISLETARRRPSSRRRVLGALGVLAVLGVFSLRLPAAFRPVGTEPVAAAPLPAAAPAAAAPGTSVELRLPASPPEARALLEGEPLAGSAFQGSFPRDAASHRLEVEAPGCTTVEEPVSRDRDRAADVSAVPSAEPVSTPSAPSAARPARVHHRSLDLKNPYAYR